MVKPIKHGLKKWRIRPFDATGIRRSFVFDSYAEAKEFGIRYLAEQDQIQSGEKRLIQKDKSAGELFDYYFDHYSSQKRNPQDDASIIRAHLRPYFQNIFLKDIHLHIEPFKLTKMHLKPKTVSNILVLLTTMLNVANEIQWLDRVPKIRKPKVGHRESEFTYLRNGDEIRRFLQAAKEVDEVAYRLFSFAIYTGCRAGECAGLRWSDIDFEKRLILVQRSYKNLTKNYEIRYIPILDPLLPILREWRLMNPGDIVFPNKHGGMFGKSARILQETLKQVLFTAGFPKIDDKTHYITFHDLRHTFASHWMMSGGDLFKLQRILGHKSIEMTQRYSHLAPDAFATEYGRIKNFTPVEGISKVVNLKNIFS